MTFVEHILLFITDSSKRISARATVIVLALTCILLIDNILGISFHFTKQWQLEQLKTIAILRKDTTLLPETKVQLLDLERKTLSRENFVDHSLSFLQNTSWTSSKTNQNKTNNNPNPISIRSNIWFLISTSGVYILVALIFVPVLLLTDKKTTLPRLLASMIIFVVIMIFTAGFNFWLFDTIIPDKIFGSWTWNYIINFILQIGLLIGVGFTTQTINKSSQTNT